MLTMPEVISCPTCGNAVSKRAIFCRSCGESITDVPQAPTVELIDSLHDDDLADCLETKYPEYRNRWSSVDEQGACDIQIPNGDFWADVEENFMPEFDELTSEFYAVEDADSLWHPFVQYVREHADECCTHRN